MPVSLKKTIQQFNTPDTILVLSKYPYDHVGHSYHGVANYTRRTLCAISEQTGKKFVVLVQNEYNRPIEFDANKKIVIIPCFDDGLQMFPQLLQTISQFNKISLLHIHSEFYTSGNIVLMAATLPFLASLRAMGKTVNYYIHNVITDFSFMARHLGRKQTDMKLRLFEKFLPAYYKSLSLCIDNIIVLDESIRQRLLHFVSAKKIFLSPLWVEPKLVTAKQRVQARQKMGISPDHVVLLCFGFMTRYKGVDWLVDTVNFLNTKKDSQKYTLILAGGKAPSQTGKKHYEEFYAELESKAKRNKNIALTGFIPEEEISQYFAGSDLVVLPYRGILGASASWGEAMSYGKPFIVSKELHPYLESHDIQTAMQNVGVKTQDMIFARNKFQFEKSLTFILQHKLKPLAQLSAQVAEMRSPQVRLTEELSLLYTPAEKRSFELAFNLERLSIFIVLSKVFSVLEKNTLK